MIYNITWQICESGINLISTAFVARKLNLNLFVSEDYFFWALGDKYRIACRLRLVNINYQQYLKTKKNKNLRYT